VSAARTVLREIAPAPSRWVAAVAVALLCVGLGWFVGAGWARAVVAALAMVVVVLVTRTTEPVEAAWPDRPAARTRPGLHVVATTQRQLEGARTDAGDRAALTERLARLGLRQPPVHPPRVHQPPATGRSHP
jgi:hypothetical protein